ncbi:MAG: MFS family permease [Sulfitobacter sp.]|jgi:MFS family permease
MTQVLYSISTLLISVFIILVGHGLQLTIAPLYASQLGWSNSTISYLGSAYYLGFALGCLTIPKLVAKVGHIRVFSVMAGAATGALLTLSLVDNVSIWISARLITGWTLAGLYMVIESWLNERATPENRGLVLSIYSALTLGAICIGQIMIGFPFNYLQLIALAAILLAVGAIPVGLTQSPAPKPIPSISFNFKGVYKASHVAVVGVFLVGLVTSGIWALGPIIAQSQGLDQHQIGYFMAITVIGGAICQLPLGRMSDRRDRRQVIVVAAFAGAIVAQLAILYSGINAIVLFTLMFIFGGMTLPLYSILLAHANDNTELPLMQVGSVILLCHSVGAVIGPLLLSLFIGYSPLAMFYFAETVLLILAGWTWWRIHSHRADAKHFEPFVDLPRTTQGAIEAYDELEHPNT